MNPSNLDRVLHAYSSLSIRNKYLLEQSASVFQAFRSQGIDFLLLKGADLLTRLYGARGIRPMVDVDLLIHEDDLPRLETILFSLGFHRQIDGNPAYTSSDGSLTFDIIHAIWYLNRASDLEGIWSRAITQSYEGVPVKRMGSDDLFLFLIAYTVVHRGSFSSSYTKDLTLLVKKESLHWEFLLQEATRLHLRIPLHHGVTFAQSCEPTLDLPSSFTKALAPSSLTERLLAYNLRKLVTKDHTDGISFFLLFLTQPGRKKLNWLWKSFFPQRTFMEYRYGQVGLVHPFRTRLTRVIYLGTRVLCLMPKICVRLLRPQVIS